LFQNAALTRKGLMSFQLPHDDIASRLPDGADEAQMFELAPTSLWLEDYRAVRMLFTQWRAEGVTDLRAFLVADLGRVAACTRGIRVIKVNRRTLSMFQAASLAHLTANLGQVFRDDMLGSHIDELVQLWEGASNFTGHSVNYTLGGARLDINLHGRILPGHEDSWARVLVAIDDVTQRETARRKLAASEAYARGLFDDSPVSLWVEDFSTVRQLLEEVRAQGIVDFRVFTDVHPEFVDRCMQEIRVIDVNRSTLDLFGAPDKATLLRRLSDIFRGEMWGHFREQLIELWNGRLFQQREVVNYALGGELLHVYLQFSVIPGHEEDWALVQVALTDITARKKAEAYLEYLGKHDVLTKLRNRSFYVDELNRLERKGPLPVTIIMADLNGLKAVNDRLGHAAGDALLRRAGEVLAKALDKPDHAARIGGDEFALLLPGTDERGSAAVIANIEHLIALNNQFYSATTLSLSMGAATSSGGERLEATVQRADALMYQAKHVFYAGEANRRTP
jgi:diguanylate cyclase (GGDEF)-like protein